jgi:hypothetical protein
MKIVLVPLAKIPSIAQPQAVSTNIARVVHCMALQWKENIISGEEQDDYGETTQYPA